MYRYRDITTVNVGECSSTYAQKIASGFFEKYLSGDLILDIGNKGSDNFATILEGAIGVDLDYPNYDGRILPFESESVDGIWASHVLEHIPDYVNAIREWHRVLKIGGHMVICVPHMFLYEKKMHPPSNWNESHVRFYTPARLLREIEETLPLNVFRIEALNENYAPGINYAELPIDQHNPGPYEIQCVIKKIDNKM